MGERPPEFARWAREVKIRDRFQCQICDLLDVVNKSSYIEAHHLYAYNAYPELREELFNGETLCNFHHEVFHRLMGYGDNTKYQFEQFIQIIQIFEKLIKEEFEKKE